MKKYKILIIEDQVQIIQSIIDILEVENSNYNFLHALNGEDGINVAANYLPDLIITDWEMPGISGIETISALKSEALTKDIPIIMLTGMMTSVSNLKTALEAGAIGYIRKPFDKIELTARIKSLLMLVDSHKEVVDLKNKELASTAMNVLKSNEFHQDLLKQVKSLSNEFGVKSKKLNEKLRVLNDKISSKIKGEAWEQFETYFKNMRPDFFKQLTLKHPDLTPAELKLSTLLCLNMTTKEIADITFNSPDSIKTARNRLRRKMNLHADVKLVNYLIQF